MACAQIPVWLSFPDIAALGDEFDGSTWTSFFWFDVSSLPQSATIDSATLIVPVTLEVGDPSTVGLILVDGEGRDQVAAPEPNDVFLDFDHQLIAYLDAPVPQAGKPPDWRPEVTAAVQSAVSNGSAYVLFRLRVSGDSDNSTDDGYYLADYWLPTQLVYVATLRVTYTD